MNINEGLDIIETALLAAQYSVKTANEPTVREWDGPLPLVFICPLLRRKIWWSACGSRAVKQAFQVVLVNDNETLGIIGQVDAFKSDLVKLFHTSVLNKSYFIGTPVWRTEVEDDMDFRRDRLPQGYTYSAARVILTFSDN